MRHKICSPKFSSTKKPTSPLRNPQRTGSLSTLTSPSDHKDQTWFSTTNSIKEGSIQTSRGVTTQVGSSMDTSNPLGDESPRVNNTRVVGGDDAPSAQEDGSLEMMELFNLLSIPSQIKSGIKGGELGRAK